MFNAHRTVNGVLLAQQGEIAVLLMPRSPGQPSGNSRRAAKDKFFRIPCQRQQKLIQGMGMMLRSYHLNHGFPRRRWMHASGHCHVCCTHHQALQGLSRRSIRNPKIRAETRFFYGSAATAILFFSDQRDLELQIKGARGTLAVVNP